MWRAGEGASSCFRLFDSRRQSAHTRLPTGRAERDAACLPALPALRCGVVWAVYATVRRAQPHPRRFIPCTVMIDLQVAPLVMSTKVGIHVFTSAAIGRDVDGGPSPAMTGVACARVILVTLGIGAHLGVRMLSSLQSWQIRSNPIVRPGNHLCDQPRSPVDWYLSPMRGPVEAIRFSHDGRIGDARQPLLYASRFPRLCV